MNKDNRQGGASIDTSRKFSFFYASAGGSEREYSAYQGDTLASALLAQGLIPPVTSEHGAETYSADVRVINQQPEIVVSAYDLQLYPGLRARACPGSWQPQRNWLSSWLSRSPSVSSVELKGLIPAPKLSCDSHNLFADVLIVGSGLPALIAARRLTRMGLRVLLIEQQQRLSPNLLGCGLQANGEDYHSWADSSVARLLDSGKLQVLSSCSAVRVESEQLLAYRAAQGDQAARLYRLGFRALLLATGAYELPLSFAGNNHPGIMLAGQLFDCLRLYGVLAARRIVFATNNSSTYQVALQAQAAGAKVCLIDAREHIAQAWQERFLAAGVRFYNKHKVLELQGHPRLKRVVTTPVDSRVGRQFIKCDLLAISGGWRANDQLAEQARQVGANYQLLGNAAGDFRELPELLRSSLNQAQQLGEQLLGLDNNFSNDNAKAKVNRLDLRLQNYWPGAQPAPTTDADTDADASALADTDSASSVVVNQLTPAVPLAVLAANAAAQPIARSSLDSWQVSVGALIEPIDAWRQVLCYPQFTEATSTACTREAMDASALGLHDASVRGLIAIEGNDADKFMRKCSASDEQGTSGCQLWPLLDADGSVLDWCQLWRFSLRQYLLLTHPRRLSTVVHRLQQLQDDEQVLINDISHSWSLMNLSGNHSTRLLANITGIAQLEIDINSWQSLEMLDSTIYCARINQAASADYLLLVNPQLAPLLWNITLEAGYDSSICTYGRAARRLLELEHGYGFLQLDTEYLYQAPRPLAAYQLQEKNSLESDQERLVHLYLNEMAAAGDLLFDGPQLVGELACVGSSFDNKRIMALAWARSDCRQSDQLYVESAEHTGKIGARRTNRGFPHEH